MLIPYHVTQWQEAEAVLVAAVFAIHPSPHRTLTKLPTRDSFPGV